MTGERASAATFTLIRIRFAVNEQRLHSVSSGPLAHFAFFVCVGVVCLAAKAMECKSIH